MDAYLASCLCMAALNLSTVGLESCSSKYSRGSVLDEVFVKFGDLGRVTCI